MKIFRFATLLIVFLMIMMPNINAVNVQYTKNCFRKKMQLLTKNVDDELFVQSSLKIKSFLVHIIYSIIMAFLYYGYFVLTIIVNIFLTILEVFQNPALFLESLVTILISVPLLFLYLIFAPVLIIIFFFGYLSEYQIGFIRTQVN